jgi:flagellar biosynthesis/type III secretory pathway M-ring protein FliF/YscJ
MTAKRKNCDHGAGDQVPSSQSKNRVPAPKESADLKSDSAKVKKEIDHLREKITQLAEKNPEKAALILSEWLNKK